MPDAVSGLSELIRQLHEQNTIHPNHGYESWKDDCPTCELLGKFAAVTAVETVVSKAEGPVRGGSA